MIWEHFLCWGWGPLKVAERFPEQITFRPTWYQPNFWGLLFLLAHFLVMLFQSLSPYSCVDGSYTHTWEHVGVGRAVPAPGG